MTHLDDNAASEFVSGALPPSAMTKVEGHLAGCRDCRQLVAALAMDAANDSNAATVPHEKLSPSQVAQRPTRKLTVGDRVGRYLVLSALGAGGMGVVFAAYDPQLDRKVALKLLRAGITYNTKDARTRLRREAQAIAQLSHPNVVAVYDVGATDDGDLYIAMEFVEGDTLTTWLKKYPRTWREIIDVFLQAARGLIAAHSVGLLHRDFKPDNVLVGGDGRVRVTDFGLARSVMTPEDARPAERSPTGALSVELTATGTVLGTPRYMPPEQLTGPDIDARADQFSFCVALYEALYGTHPLPGATSVSMLEAGEKALPPPEGSKVPAAIARIVSRGLECDRAKRFPTMSALTSELAPRETRSPMRFAAAAGVGLLLVAGAVAAVLARPPQQVEVTPLDNEGQPVGVQPLVDKINELTSRISELEAERRADHQKLVDALTQADADQSKIQLLQTELERKDVEMKRLVQEVVQLQLRDKPRTQSRAQRLLVIRAIHQAHASLEGCFIEWSEREPGDANLLVRLTVGPDGVGHSSKAAAGPESPSLRWCVAGGIGRVAFPTGPEQLEVEVDVHWSAGFLTVSPRVVAQRTVVPETFDLR